MKTNWIIILVLTIVAIVGWWLYFSTEDFDYEQIRREYKERDARTDSIVSAYRDSLRVIRYETDSAMIAIGKLQDSIKTASDAKYNSLTGRKTWEDYQDIDDGDKLDSLQHHIRRLSEAEDRFWSLFRDSTVNNR